MTEKKRKDKNSDGCSGDGIKWYKAENAESIMVFCQAEGFKLRLKPLVQWELIS